MLIKCPNVIGPKGSNSDSETNHFIGSVMLRNNYPLLYKHFFHNVSLSEKVFGGYSELCDDLIMVWPLLILGAWSWWWG